MNQNYKLILVDFTLWARHFKLMKNKRTKNFFKYLEQQKVVSQKALSSIIVYSIKYTCIV